MSIAKDEVLATLQWQLGLEREDRVNPSAIRRILMPRLRGQRSPINVSTFLFQVASRFSNSRQVVIMAMGVLQRQAVPVLTRTAKDVLINISRCRSTSLGMIAPLGGISRYSIFRASPQFNVWLNETPDLRESPSPSSIVTMATLSLEPFLGEFCDSMKPVQQDWLADHDRLGHSR